MSGTQAISHAGVRRSAASSALPVYTAAILLSAFLLFAVQPMFTKMVLPRLGGTPAVWSVAMVFFQACLLGGYVYAHLLSTRLSPRRAALVHIGFLGAVLATSLPIALAAGFDRPPVENETGWLIAAFAASVGLPFLAVSANGPLLQAWFARTGHPHARDPYFLYAASNVGSFVALLGYPLAVEPFLALTEQGRAWAWGFALLLAAVAGCAAFVVGRGNQAVAPAAAGDAPVVPRRGERLSWIGLAFVPSALLVAVTAHISTDVAAAPFLWVLPLSLFLLTFVLTFRARPVIDPEAVLRFQPVIVLIPLLMLARGTSLPLPLDLTIHLSAFFATALVCHRALMDRRPPASRLTEFYVCLSLGGVLGGVFAGLLAPHVFSWVAEYPLLLVAGLLCQPGAWTASSGRRHLRDVAAIGLCAALLALPSFALDPELRPRTGAVGAVVLVAVIALAIAQRRRPVRVAAFAAAGFGLVAAYAPQGAAETHRSFFGVHKIVASADGRHRLLYHGTTLHGAQALRGPDGSPAAGRPEPLTYFSREGSLAEGIEVARAVGGGLGRVAIIGVGTGSLACYRQDGETWTFFEIDPLVVEIARDPAKFGFLSSCAPDAAFVLGDARLTIADAPDGSFDLIVLDAFSSDAVPTHLVTAEAMNLFLRKLAPDGSLVLNVSNRNIDLSGVVAAAAAGEGLSARFKQVPLTAALLKEMKLPPEVAFVGRTPAHAAELAARGGWTTYNGPPVRAWTDDYADLLGAIRRRFDRSRS